MNRIFKPPPSVPKSVEHFSHDEVLWSPPPLYTMYQPLPELSRSKPHQPWNQQHLSPKRHLLSVTSLMVGILLTFAFPLLIYPFLYILGFLLFAYPVYCCVNLNTSNNLSLYSSSTFQPTISVLILGIIGALFTRMFLPVIVYLFLFAIPTLLFWSTNHFPTSWTTTTRMLLGGAVLLVEALIWDRVFWISMALLLIGIGSGCFQFGWNRLYNELWPTTTTTTVEETKTVPSLWLAFDSLLKSWGHARWWIMGFSLGWHLRYFMPV